MSQIIEKLSQVSKGVTQSMGFRAAPATARPVQMVLVAALEPTENINSVAEYAPFIDALCFDLTSSALPSRDIQKLVKALPDIAWGALLDEASQKDADSLLSSGADFIIFSAGSPFFSVPQGKLGKVLLVDYSLGEDLLRGANDLPIDAVMAWEAQPGPLSWQRLMVMQRIASVLAKPLLNAVPISLSGGELKAIWQMGVDGLMVRTVPEDAAQRLSELRQNIDSLAALPRRKRGKTEAVLPVVSSQPEPAENEEEEEDE